jgi:hypothetical protein
MHNQGKLACCGLRCRCSRMSAEICLSASRTRAGSPLTCEARTPRM